MRTRQLIWRTTTFLLFAVIISCVNATQVKTIEVGPLGEELIFQLNNGDKFSGSLSISGLGNDIFFWITDPRGNSILHLGTITEGTSFEFTAQRSGAYTFHFTIPSLMGSRTVTLSYDITFSFDIGNLFTIISNPFTIIIGLVMAITAIIVFLGAHFYEKKRQTISKPSQPLPT